jgi:hypothetical protein
MTNANYQLAQVNIARMLAPITDPIMADFVNNLERINGLAESAPGFIWRLKTPAGDATSLRVFDDEWMIINMSVWDSVDALHQFTYYSPHVEIYRRRKEWFSKLTELGVALWWVPAGYTPTPEDAKAKLAYLNAHGPTPLAFTFKQPFTVDEMHTATPSASM